MAVSAFKFTDAGYLAVRKGTILLESDTIVAVLVDNAHTPNISTDALYSAISANECADADYTTTFSEGLTITSLAWTNPTARDFALDAADLDFGNTVTISARYCYFVKRAGATLVSGDLIIGYYDLNDGGAANVSSTSANFDIAHAAGGFFTETITPAS